MVCIFTTGGSSNLCCGCPKPEEGSKCGCGMRNGNRTLQMAMAVEEGVKEYGGVNVHIHDIRFEGQCPDYDTVASVCDAIVLGSPVHAAMPANDMTIYTNKWKRVRWEMACKIGAAFTTGTAMYAGTELTMRILHARLQTFQLNIVGGSDWQTNPGAAAVTEHGEYWADGGDSGTHPGASSLAEHEPEGGEDDEFRAVDPMFLSQARGLGYRVAAVTKVAFEGGLTPKGGLCSQPYGGLQKGSPTR